MKKNVWLINQYLCTPELNGDGHRHSFLADEFIKKGYDVTLITSSFSHVPYRENKFKGLFKINEGEIRTLLIKGNIYKSTQGVSRVFSWFIFSFFLFFIPLKKIPRPDIIIVSSNSLLPILNVVFYFKKKFKKVKFILEIRDIWPLTLIEVGNYSKNNIFIKFLAWVEKIGYEKADHIVSLLRKTDLHIKNKLKNQLFNYTWISNGYQLQNKDYYKKLDDRITKQIPKDKFIVGYAGSIGKANDMEHIVEVFSNFKRNDICLCLLGDGDNVDLLKKIANNSENIKFLGRTPKNEVDSFLNYCDILYLGVKDIPLYKFGLSMNKTFDYMYAEKPILLSAPVGSIIEDANCGIVVKPNNSKDLIKAILKLKKLSNQERKILGLNGKKHLLDHFTYDELSVKYINIFENI